MYPEADLVLPIFMPLWDRLERLKDTVDMLNDQTDQHFELVVWLNGATSERESVVQAELDRLLQPSFFCGSSENLGGWARYKAFRSRYPSPNDAPQFAILMDDDTDPEPNFIHWCRLNCNDRAIVGRHAWRFNSPTKGYWARTQVGDSPTEVDAHTVSTQATVLDTWVLKGKEILDVDPEFVFGVEDLWLCYVATVFYSYSIRGGRPPVSIRPDGKDTWKTIKERKTEVLMELRSRGWKV